MIFVLFFVVSLPPVMLENHTPVPCRVFEFLAGLRGSNGRYAALVTALEALNDWCHNRLNQSISLTELKRHAALVDEYLADQYDHISLAYGDYTAIHMLLCYSEVCSGVASPQHIDSSAQDCIIYEYHDMALKVVCADISRSLWHAGTRWDPARAAVPYSQRLAAVLHM